MVSICLLFAAFAALLGQTIAEDVVNLNFEAATKWEGESVEINCTYGGKEPKQASSMRFWSVQNEALEIRVETDCHKIEWKAVNNTFGDNLALKSEKEQILKWTNLSVSNGAVEYKCSLTLCKATDDLMSQGQNFSVHKLPDTPKLEPSSAIVVYHNETTSKNFRCEGYVGPKGTMSLIIMAKDGSQNYIDNYNFTNVDEKGYNNVTIAYERAYQRVNNTADKHDYSIKCEAWSSEGGSNVTLFSNEVPVYVEYPPESNYLSVYRGNQQLTLDEKDKKYQVTANYPDKLFIKCTCNYSKFKCLNYLKQVSGPTDGYFVLEDGSTAMAHLSIKEPNGEDNTVVLSCQSNYTSLTHPERPVSFESQLAIFSNAKIANACFLHLAVLALFSLMLPSVL